MRRAWRWTRVLLVANVVVFVTSTMFMTSRPLMSLALAGANVVALACPVGVDRAVMHAGQPSLWKDGRPRRPDEV